MTRLLTIVILASVLGCGPVVAQVAGIDTAPDPSLGIGATSPLNMTPNMTTPVVPTGIPLGATEITTSGLSSPLCGSSTPGSSPGSATVFDGGGTTLTAPGICAADNNTGLAQPPEVTSSQTTIGQMVIPLGSTELGAEGLSPPPIALTVPSISSPLSTSSTLSSSSALSTGGNSVSCPTTGQTSVLTGVFPRSSTGMTSGSTTSLPTTSTIGTSMPTGSC